MSILTKLKKCNTIEKSDYISKDVFECNLYRLGVDRDVIDDCLEEPQKIWSQLLQYFETKHRMTDK